MDMGPFALEAISLRVAGEALLRPLVGDDGLYTVAAILLACLGVGILCGLACKARSPGRLAATGRQLPTPGPSSMPSSAPQPTDYVKLEDLHEFRKLWESDMRDLHAKLEKHHGVTRQLQDEHAEVLGQRIGVMEGKINGLRTDLGTCNTEISACKSRVMESKAQLSESHRDVLKYLDEAEQRQQTLMPVQGSGLPLQGSCYVRQKCGSDLR